MVDYRKGDRQSGLALSRALQTLPPSTPLPEVLPTPPEPPISPLARLAAQLDKPALDATEQTNVLNELARYLKDPSTATGSRELLVRMAKRPDLIPMIDKELDSLLNRTLNRQISPLVIVGGIVLLVVVIAVTILLTRQNGSSGPTLYPTSAADLRRLTPLMPDSYGSYSKGRVDDNPNTDAASVSIEYQDDSIPASAVLTITTYPKAADAQTNFATMKANSQNDLAIGEGSYFVMDTNSSTILEAGAYYKNATLQLTYTNPTKPLSLDDVKLMLKNTIANLDKIFS
jgi:hypothetical protein